MTPQCCIRTKKPFPCNKGIGIIRNNNLPFIIIIIIAVTLKFGDMETANFLFKLCLLHTKIKSYQCFFQHKL